MKGVILTARAYGVRKSTTGRRYTARAGAAMIGDVVPTRFQHDVGVARGGGLGAGAAAYM
jgi:hypothetical protein